MRTTAEVCSWLTPLLRYGLGYDWGPEESNKVDEDADFNELYGRCSRRGLKFDGLLFDLTLMSNPTLRSNYFGKSRTLP